MLQGGLPMLFTAVGMWWEAVVCGAIINIPWMQDMEFKNIESIMHIKRFQSKVRRRSDGYN